MDRVLVGRATTNTTSSYYHRSGQQGLFISKPGANVHNCGDGELIFDSTAAGLVQILGRGRASVPKQLYDKGIFGEPGIITEDNWNSSATFPAELNSKTCWLFDAVSDVQDQIDEVIKTTTIPYWLRSVENPSLISETDWTSGLSPYASLMDLGNIGKDVYVRAMSKRLWRIQENVFPFLSKIPLINNFNSQMGPMQVPSYNTGDILNRLLSDGSSEVYGTVAFAINSPGTISTNIRNNNPDLFVPAYAGGVLTDPNIGWAFTTKDGGFTIETTEREPIDLIKLLSAEEIQPLIDNDKIFDYISPAWKTAWANYYDSFPVASPARYPDTTAWAGYYLIKDQPRPWRALSSAGGDRSKEAEKGLILLFFQYQFILSWLYNNFGLYVNDNTNTYGPFDWQYQTSLNYVRTAGDGDSGIAGFSTNDYLGLVNGQPNPLADLGIGEERRSPDFEVDAGTTAKYFTDYTSTSNWQYTKWSSGNIDISTGIEAPNDSSMPVQVWWNTISRDTGNNSTNLSFLNIRDNLVKSSTASERLTALKPGIPTITGNTYIEDNKIRLKFEQPSTEDTVEVYYTIFKENAFQDFAGAVDSFIFNITDVSDPNYPGDNYAGRRQQEPAWTAMNQGQEHVGTTRSDYGRYYNIVFPDDFVRDRNTTTDPFRGYRNSNGVIDYPLHITLNIPEGVEVSSNSYAKLIKFDELHNPHTLSFFQGSAAYGPKDPAGRQSNEKDAMVDPCIKLNLSSQEFTNRALQGLEIRIENNGVLVGGGGYGQYGQVVIGTKGFSSATGGGGGGGGAGYHPPWLSENPSSWSGQKLVSASDYITSIGSTVNTLPATDPSGTTDWVYHWAGRIDDKARYTDRSATSEVEKDAHRSAISGFWSGPNNYVEWGIGGFETVNNHMTGMNGITIKSISPGKGGTGYMGPAPNQNVEGEGAQDHAGFKGFPRWNRRDPSDPSFIAINREFLTDFSFLIDLPYYETLLERRDAYGRYGDDLYPRLVGTYQIQGSVWIPRFDPSLSLIGSPGNPGGIKTGGSGGGKAAAACIGSDQDQWTSIDWTGLDASNLFAQGRPSSGHGGSVVYLYANTNSSLSGTRVELINNLTGIVKSGGGGGSAGGTSSDGLDGGDLGRPGKWYTGFGAVHNARAGTPDSAGSSGFPTDPFDTAYGWTNHTIRGEPGRLVWWNTTNVISSYTIENKSKTKTAAIEGLDYNPGIQGWDYVSYLPDIDVTIPKSIEFVGPGAGPVTVQIPWVTTGLKLWGRKLDDGGHTVYTKMNEQSFEQYLITIGATVSE